jgi:hypothetical protein
MERGCILRTTTASTNAIRRATLLNSSTRYSLHDQLSTKLRELRPGMSHLGLDSIDFPHFEGRVGITSAETVAKVCLRVVSRMVFCREKAMLVQQTFEFSHAWVLRHVRDNRVERGIPCNIDAQ